MIRLIDFVASLIGLILLTPLFLIISIWIKLDDRKGPVFYKQTRVGKNGVDFDLYKFRSMYVGADKGSLITIGGRDSRITRSGYFIRKYKLDELPQLINVLRGEMSLVGPRPEVRKYVDLYTPEQRRVLEVKPGITDWASIEYIDENALLALSDDPNKTYIEEVMPAKIKLNMRFINHPTLGEYLTIILKTFMGISLDKVFSWYFNKESLPYWGVLILDMAIAYLAIILGYSIVNGVQDLLDNFWKVSLALICYFPVFCVTGKIFHTFDIQFRLATLVDLQRVGGAMLSGTVIIYVIRQFFPLDQWIWELNGSTVLIGALLATFFIMLERVVVKGVYDYTHKIPNRLMAVIYGTPESVSVISGSVQALPERSYSIKGYLVDNPHQNKRFIDGIPAIEKDESTIAKLQKMNVSALICSPSKGELIKKDHVFISQLTEAGIKILLMPPVEDLEDGFMDGSHPFPMRELEMEDLIPREQVEIDKDAISDLLHDNTILITGAAGSIGSELVRQIAAYKPKMMILVDQAETPMHALMLEVERDWPEQKFVAVVCSITQASQMEELFSKYHPDYVFHAAAYKHVPLMEISPANAVQNNCVGTRVLADMAVAFGVKKFVMISTDKVVNPTSVMGCSKRICEIYCQNLNNVAQNNTQFITTRFGNVLGSNGSVITIFREQIKKGGPVTVTHPDVVRYFMFQSEVCKLVLQAGTMGKGGEIFAFDMGEPVRIVDLAQRMIKMCGTKDIRIEYTGLRDGEKLYEEVISEAEDMVATSHPKILAAKVRVCDFELVRQNEMELEGLSYRYDEMAIVKKMKEIVPEFKSQHSRFEILDK